MEQTRKHCTEGLLLEKCEEESTICRKVYTQRVLKFQPAENGYHKEFKVREEVKGGGVQKAREREDPYAMLKNLNNQEDDGDSKKGFNNRKEMYFLKTILGKNVKDK